MKQHLSTEQQFHKTDVKNTGHKRRLQIVTFLDKSTGETKRHKIWHNS